jgi:16S rRNA (adenine1518-N6/adenine1519-N6)-dimethyltransferase
VSGSGAEEGRKRSWKELREKLTALGFRPSRRFGQNFLLDDNLARALVRDAGITAGAFVLEVGPGLGRLTTPLLDAGARVTAVEIDGRLVELLKEELGECAELELLHTDVLSNKHTLEPEVAARLPAEEEWHLVANLPYSISAPLLVVLANLGTPPTSMSILVQREVADRIRAIPATSAWGPLSVRLQAAYRTRAGREVDPALFWPSPKVKSAVVHLDRRADAPGAEELRSLSELVGALFSRRRQVLGRVLGDLLGDRGKARALLAEQGIDPGSRAEILSVEALRALAASPAWQKTSKKTPGTR